ncbi:hypothetical protein ACSBR2_004646 [Camellia fascicularis]
MTRSSEKRLTPIEELTFLDLKTGIDITEALRLRVEVQKCLHDQLEWANSLCRGATLPLPMPLKGKKTQALNNWVGIRQDQEKLLLFSRLLGTLEILMA